MTDFFATILARAASGKSLAAEDALALAECEDLPALMRTAAALRDAGHGGLVTYSRKVFIPLTQLCRDVCHYCTFAHPPRKGERVYLTRGEVLDIARAGANAGCHEALFTLATSRSCATARRARNWRRSATRPRFPTSPRWPG